MLALPLGEIPLSTEVVISAAKPEMVEMLWHIVGPMLDRAVQHSNGELDLEVIKEQLIAKEMLLLLVNREDKIIAAFALERRDFDTGKSVLVVTTAGGEGLEDWKEELDKVLNSLAKEHGCEDIYIVGRAGWVRSLKHIGYSVCHTVVSRKVH